MGTPRGWAKERRTGRGRTEDGGEGEKRGSGKPVEGGSERETEGGRKGAVAVVVVVMGGRGWGSEMGSDGEKGGDGGTTRDAGQVPSS